MQTQLDTETDAFDLSSEQTVLEYTQASSDPVLCRAKLLIGDATKPLDGTGGNFTVRVTVDGVEIFSASETVAISAASTAAVWQSSEFTVDEDSDVAILLTSPNAADTDVNVTAILYGTDIAADYEVLTTHLVDAAKICNMALGNLGDLTQAKRLSSFSRSAATTNAQHACLDFYDEAKREMLGMMEWECAKKVVAMTVSDDAPLLNGKWTYKYTKPADCLILRAVIDTAAKVYEWEEIHEQRSGSVYNDQWICTNVIDAIARYTINVGENEYLPGMATLHSMILARMIAMTVKADTKVRLAFVQEMRLETRKTAQAIGGKEGYVPDEKGTTKISEVY